MALSVIPVPMDTVTTYMDIVDENGVVTRTARDQVTFMELEISKQEINIYVK